ncbi:MAG: cell surface protein [Rhodoferax sp.]
MKKNVLALSITAALIGLTGTASAMTTVGGADATGLALNGDGVGHMLLVPYFSAQGANSTLINITNTDMNRGKAVKVRFRGAANSDDLFDFQVFLSPGDVWAANISKGADGIAVLTTNDVSCTKPAKATLSGGKFGTLRLDSTLTADQKANGTREGYVEIFNMGDIPPLKAGIANVVDAPAGTTAGIDATAATANPLYTAIKHVAKVAPCSGTAWTAIDTTDLAWDTVVASGTNPVNKGLLPPTTGLMANWTIINVTNAAAWSGEAVAIQATIGAAAAKGNVVYWPQTGVALTSPAQDAFTADPLLRSANVYKWDGAAYVLVATPAIAALNVDLPDMSTPYFGAATALTQAASLTAAIAAKTATNEFLTDTSITASTDWVFSMPTRRYSTSFNYAATIAATDDGRRFTDIVADATFAAAYFNRTNTSVAQTAATNNNGRQICVTKSTMTLAVTDREESATPTAVVISPAPVAAALVFCGEGTVLSINNGGIKTTGTGALTASVAVQDLDVTYRDGFMTIATPAADATKGLPVLGSAFSRAFAGANSFGATYKHRFGR